MTDPRQATIDAAEAEVLRLIDTFEATVRDEAQTGHVSATAYKGIAKSDLKDAIAALRASLAETPAGWRETGEEDPRDGQEVLAAIHPYNNPQNAWLLVHAVYRDGQWFCPAEQTGLHPAVYWMPAPAPPGSEPTPSAWSGDPSAQDYASTAAPSLPASGAEPVFTPAMIEAVYAAWHGAGVDIAGGDWKRFVGMLATPASAPPSAVGGVPFGWYLEPQGYYSPTFKKGSEPPAPLTREEAMEGGWVPMFATPASAPPDPNSWEANAQFLLDRCPYTVWQCEGGGPADLKATLAVTFQGMQMRLEGHPMFAAKATPPSASVPAASVVEALRSEVEKHKSDWSRFHHLMAKHGLHPGRTDDDLLTILDAALSTPHADRGMVPLTEEQIEALRGLDTDKRVRFYEHDFYVLSNFSAFTLVWKGIRFDTSEAAYHFEKFTDPEGAMADVRAIQWDIRTAPSAHEAFKVAERNRAHRRPDWDEVKVGIMREILRAKVEQHEYVRRKLLATGDRELVEDSWRDDFWGWGPNRDGKNTLGRLWMEVRAELRAHGITGSGE